jgi:AcrR family transcriptional regulator
VRVATKRVRLEHDERRRQILLAARRLFCQRPYAQVSTTEIAEAAGIARGLLNHYFGTKRDLYLEVIRDVARVPTMPHPEGAAGLPNEQVWEASVDGWMAIIEANRDLWLTAIGAGGVGRDPELDAILNDAREVVAERAADALGLEQTPTVLALVRGYGGFAEEITREWLERGRLSREQARVLLLGALPLLASRLFPDVVRH